MSSMLSGISRNESSRKNSHSIHSIAASVPVNSPMALNPSPLTLIAMAAKKQSNALRVVFWCAIWGRLAALRLFVPIAIIPLCAVAAAKSAVVIVVVIHAI
ncbi:hypothetical protein NQ176_g6126 [Zarea fungicola]|uniref:Uncharacterized protein n=1 Tax=Zarea fungicola TaxID=93591 RepID=A0ACC1N5Y4_9HYPO|nr:hypothetical protein NQ176_g6126 [Lecanicillium fungicola]